MLTVRHSTMGVVGSNSNVSLHSPRTDFVCYLCVRCQVVAWPSPSTGTLMEGNLPPERYESEGHPGTPFIVFVIRFAKLFVAVAYALRCQMHIKSLTEIPTCLVTPIARRRRLAL